MFTSRAHSFQQQARLAVSLSWVGGFVNAIAFLECAQLFTSHLTGAVTLMGIEVVAMRWTPVFLALEVFAAFVFGAMVSSLLTELARRRQWASRYVAPIALEATLLALMGLLLELDVGLPRVAIGLAACAMGLQNGTITQVSGAVVRSTHITGVVTDLGVEVVQAWYWWRDAGRRGRPTAAVRFWQVSTWPPRLARLVLLSSILGSFTVGVLMAVLGHALLPRVAIVAPVVFLLSLLWRDWRHPLGSIREVDPLGEHDLREQGLDYASIPAGVGIYWLGRSRPVGAHPDATERHERYYRAPDFQAWMERLPEITRRPVLVLSPHVVLDENAALDLDHVARRLRASGRRLVLAGLTASQRAVLDQHGCLAVVGKEYVFPEARQAVEALRARQGQADPDDGGDEDSRGLRGL